MPIDRAAAQEIVAEFTRVFPRALGIGFYLRDTTTELYGARRQSVPTTMKGGFVPGAIRLGARALAGRVDICLGNMNDADDLVATLRHEVLGHFAASELPHGQRRALLAKIIQGRNQPGLDTLWTEVNASYAGESLEVRAEEVLALQCEAVAPHHVMRLQGDARCHGALRDILADPAPLNLQRFQLLVLLIASSMRFGAEHRLASAAEPEAIAPKPSDIKNNPSLGPSPLRPRAQVHDGLSGPTPSPSARRAAY